MMTVERGIGERVRQTRLGRNLTQTELADKAEMSVDTVNKLETGKRHPHPRTIRRVAKALKVDEEYLTGGVGQ